MSLMGPKYKAGDLIWDPYRDKGRESLMLLLAWHDNWEGDYTNKWWGSIRNGEYYELAESYIEEFCKVIDVESGASE